MDANLKIKFAETSDELLSCYSIIHDTYRNMGVIKPRKSGIYVNIFNTIPTTKVLSIKEEKSSLCTLTLINDSEIGLPCDEHFLKEINLFRKNNLKIMELGGFASRNDLRKKDSKAASQLLKSAFYYAYVKKIDVIIGGVNTRYKNLYKKMLYMKFPLEAKKYGLSNKFETNFGFTLREDFPKVFAVDNEKSILFSNFKESLTKFKEKSIDYETFKDIFIKKENKINDLNNKHIQILKKYYPEFKYEKKEN